MRRKVFISFLGKGRYSETCYSYPDGEISAPVRFVQEASINHFCSNWTENDIIYIFHTRGAFDENWLDNTDIAHAEGRREGLESRLSRMNLRTRIENEFIKDGVSEQELWKIFDSVYIVLKQGDELYIDITQALRSIPLFCSVLFNYARCMKEVDVVSVTYGAFELATDKDGVKISPILDLTGLVQLEQYTELASGLRTFGRVHQTGFHDITQRASEEEGQSIYNKLWKALADYDNCLTTNRMSDLREGKFYRDFVDAYNELKLIEDRVPAPLMRVFEAIMDSFNGFSHVKNDFKNVERAIEWAREYKMLALAYTLAREYVVTRLSELLSAYSPFQSSEDRFGEKYKEFLSKLCAVKDLSNPNNLRGELSAYGTAVSNLSHLEVIKNLRKDRLYYNLSDNRNIIDHGQNRKSYLKLSNELWEVYIKCKQILDDYEKHQC